MGRGRGDGQPGLIERVRWGNVARLAALVAGGLLIAVGPRSCGARPPTAVELPAPRAASHASALERVAGVPLEVAPGYLEQAVATSLRLQPSNASAVFLNALKAGFETGPLSRSFRRPE